MDSGIVLAESIDSLEMVSLRLRKLNNMINTICLGMGQENIEQQAIDCMESIGYCVRNIQTVVFDRLLQIQEMQNNIDKKQ